MSETKKFLSENMPCRCQVRFTLVRKNGGAVIAGEIVMCDVMGRVIEKSGMLYRTPRELYQAAEDMNCLCPQKEEFFAALETVLG